jgi:ribosomal protein S18 acetylase RimI-like enzyme
MPAKHPLDNPFWSSLDTLHRDVALGGDGVLRYPADVAPFLGVADADVDIDAALDALVPAGETVLLMGVAPSRLPAGWSLRAYDDLLQMECAEEVAPEHDEAPEIVPLGPAQRPDVLALTALVYPHYFRPRTMDLGRYFGVYVDGRLAAMIGERLGMPGHREMSAICTHPDFGGRGHARRLTAMLSNDTLRRGDVPFLHVAQDNARAVALYASLGYSVRRRIPFWSLRRG